MGDEDMSHGMDTIIYLVDKLPTERGSPSSKKRRKETKYSESEEEVDKIYADSWRLQQCSKYFKTCMNQRWSQSEPVSSQMEFHLELQTGVVYYEDCFSRMKPFSFYKPIQSVSHCLELLKVASQIVYQEVMDLGMKHLAAVPWSPEEEKQIRGFCDSEHIFVDPEVHCDLIERLRLPSAEKERQEELLKFTQGEVLRPYLKYALSECSTRESRQRFEEAFQKIVFGSNGCAQVECMTFVKTETVRLLLSFKDGGGPQFHQDVIGFCWLYGLLRSVSVAQLIVDLLLKERDVVRSMCDYENLNNERHESDEHKKAHRKWIKLIHSIFQDVLNGRLFLTSLERYTLFMDWYRNVDGCFQDVFDDNDLTELFTLYIMTFPLQKQKEMIESWEMRRDDGFGTYKYFMFGTYEEWMMRLVKELASKREQDLTGAEGKPSDSAEQFSSLRDTGK